MNQYPTWKYLLIVVILAIGTIYALPNLYADDPAIQISLARGQVLVDELRQDVEDALSEEQIATKGIETTDKSVLVRFADTQQQGIAADLLKRRMGETNTVALNLAPATPDWLRALSADPMVMGLDLQGGVHFLMQVDMKAAKRQAIERYEDDVRTMLREDRGSVGRIRYKSTKAVGDDVVVQLRTLEDREIALNRILGDLPELQYTETESADSFDIRLTITAAKLNEIADTALKQNLTTLRNRVNELGVAEPIVQQQGEDRIVVQLPGVQDTAEAKRILGATATLEYRAVCMNTDAESAAESGRVPAGCRLYKQRGGGNVLLNRSIIVSGDQLTNATSGFDSQNGIPQVNVTLDNVGAERMRQFTLDNVDNQMAVVFIERKPVTRVVGEEVVRTTRIIEEVISVATIQEPFGKRFRTTGLDPAEASELSLLLRAGALAAPVEIVEERTVGPSLGQDNIEKGYRAVKIGFIAVLIFMAVYYRLFGIVADLALFANLVMIVSMLSMLGATLTLPGIAGIVLTVGMAVDANVLIFERIREELKNGSTPQAAIRGGYEKAFSTITDANVTTLVAAIVLFTFGTGPIKGFAVTLSLGILTSMFTAIMGTRAVINLIYGRQARVKSLSI
jgi:preprotein translocase subunit SecD